MKRALLLGMGLFILSFVPAEASVSGRLDRDNPRDYGVERASRQYVDHTTARGKRGRKYVRRFSLAANLKGDKLHVFNRYGYTPHRLGTRFAGKRTERWKYYSLGVEFVFDYEGNLLEERSFPPEGNHID